VTQTVCRGKLRCGSGTVVGVCVCVRAFLCECVRAHTRVSCVRACRNALARTRVSTCKHAFMRKQIYTKITVYCYPR
jgi:hypothetical protein